MARNPSRRGRIEILVKRDQERDCGLTPADWQALDKAVSAFLGVDLCRRKSSPKRPDRKVFLRRSVKCEPPSLAFALYRGLVARAIERGLVKPAESPSSEGWADQIKLDESND